MRIAGDVAASVAGVTVIAGLVVALPLLGFGAAGVTAGSYAAGAMSATTTGGGLFALAQRVGAGGFDASTYALCAVGIVVARRALH